MNWSDCPVIEVVPDRMSGAPVVRHSRVRPQDLLANKDEGAEWLAEAHGLAVEDVNAVLAFNDRYEQQLSSTV
jgi:uncharacterized protein (DUF433 family)